MSNRKLKLDELKVQSFVTTFSENDRNTVKGGYAQLQQATKDESGDCCSGNAGCNTQSKPQATNVCC